MHASKFLLPPTHLTLPTSSPKYHTKAISHAYYATLMSGNPEAQTYSPYVRNVRMGDYIVLKLNYLFWGGEKKERKQKSQSIKLISQGSTSGKWGKGKKNKTTRRLSSDSSSQGIFPIKYCGHIPRSCIIPWPSYYFLKDWEQVLWSKKPSSFRRIRGSSSL